MELALQALNGGESSSVNVSEEVFGVEFKQTLVHQVVTAYQAAGRSGTKAQKSRSQVRGSTAKPWRQKGTGRARAGCVRSPLWRSGGVTFAASPRDYTQKLNKKMYRGALRSIFSELIRQERLVVVDGLSVSEPKTKALLAQLKAFEGSSLLLVVDALEENMMLAARNLVKIAAVDAVSVDPVNLLWADKVLVTPAAMKQLEEKLG
ncbi:50S ribosomal protein L4 [Candidatus Venteria ishoeyi]|uniref:Large ribosomal subunit protein uL4 n=1 Tax=Candidatus Venteria ishoeyi TaxID=1899563 RepID=A0A1H6F9J2_9GAMM|nr:50S ribosomal protein L4 [Candidatus Venteria ishoeyi]MDM8545901.1 50S ribosomal protein L4 [Candidatus Venteria ishoeyi]SEH05979.1 50S ribosomal protein L4 [Candidatus Venteria ishoeyi]